MHSLQRCRCYAASSECSVSEEDGSQGCAVTVMSCVLFSVDFVPCTSGHRRRPGMVAPAPSELSSDALLAGGRSAACACSSSGDSSLDGEDSALDAPDWEDAPADLSEQVGLCKSRCVPHRSGWKHLLTGDHNTLAPLLMLGSHAPRDVSGTATYAAPVAQGGRAARGSAWRRSRARRRHARGAAPLPGRAGAPLRRRQHHGQPGRRQHQAGERARGAERRGRARPGLLAPVPRAGGAHGRRAPARRPARSRRAAPAASMSRFDRWCCTDEAACPGLP